MGDTVRRIDGTDPLPRWTPSDGAAGPEAGAPTSAPETVQYDAGPVTPDRKQKAEKPAPLPPDEAAEASHEEKREAAEAHAPEAGAPSDEDRPELLTEARGGAPDDLKRIKGIGPKLEKLCNQLGVWHFDQIASWTDREVAWVDHHLEGFNGRIERDEWVAQAKALAAGNDGDSGT